VPTADLSAPLPHGGIPIGIMVRESGQQDMRGSVPSHRAYRIPPALAGWLQFARALRSCPFALLWAGQTISVLGDAVFTIAITWEVLILTGSSTAMSLLVIAQWAPKVLLLAFGGVIADRLPRRLLMLWADAGRGCIVFVVAWLAWTHVLQFWHLLVLAPLFGMVSSFFDPAYQAIMPQLVEQEALASVNALTTLSRNIGFLLGPLLSAASIALTGPASAFAFDGFTFLLSALCLFALRLPRSSAAPAPQVSPPVAPGGEHELLRNATAKGISGGISEAREGLRYVFGIPWLWVTTLVFALASIGFGGSMWVALPRLVYDVYHTGVWLIGAMATSDAVGSIIAALALGNAHKLRHRGIVAYASIIVIGFALAACALPLPRAVEPVVAIFASAMVGSCVATFMIIWGTLQQENVPNDILGRVSSITQLGVAAALPGGLVLAGLLADHIGPAQVFALGGVLAAVPAAVGLCLRDIRRVE
jgi:MFS family permease